LRTVIAPQTSHAGASPISAAFDWSSAFAATVTVVEVAAVAVVTTPFAIRSTEATAWMVSVTDAMTEPDGVGRVAAAASITASRRADQSVATDFVPVPLAHESSSLRGEAAGFTMLMGLMGSAEGAAPARRGAFASR
jgi:hypothetical protein